MSRIRLNLADELRTWRHMPPGTQLPLPPRAEDKQLLADLLALRDDQDQVQWLWSHRRAAIAQLALREVLDRLASLATGMRRAQLTGYPVPDYQAAWLGQLLDSPSGADPFAPLALPDTPKADTLRGILWEVRHLLHTPAGLETTEPLLMSLLQLPEAIDPIAWLQSEEGQRTAHLAGHTLLDTSGDRSRFIHEGAERRRTVLHDSVSIDRATITLGEIASLEQGTCIKASVSIGTKDLIVSDPGLRTVIEWPGFDQVVDDLGYRYLELRHLTTISTEILPEECHEDIQITFYPAVAKGATLLELSSHPVVFNVGYQSTSTAEYTRSAPLVLSNSLAFTIKVLENE